MEEFMGSFGSWFSNAYTYIMSRMSLEVILYFVIAVLVLIIIYAASRILKRRRLTKRLEELKVEKNGVTGNQLTYKYNRAAAFAKFNTEITRKFEALAKKYDICMQSIDNCDKVFDDAQDFLERHRYKKASKSMDELDQMLKQTQERIRIVNNALDNLLKQEREVRDKQSVLRERAKNIKSMYQDKRSQFFSGAFYMDSLFDSIDDQFDSLEEWMYSSDFRRAVEETEKISVNLDTLQELTTIYPALYRKARQDFPTRLKSLSLRISEIEDKGIDITSVNAQAKLEALSNALSDSVVKLDNGNYKAAQKALEEISEQLDLLEDDVTKERQAFDEIHGDLNKSFGVVEQIESDLMDVKNLYANIKDRFGLEDWSVRFSQAEVSLNDLKERREAVKKMLKDETFSQSDAVHDYREFTDLCYRFKNQTAEMKRMLSAASTDETRARKQLLKLELILNEIKLKVVSRDFPNLKDKVPDDLAKAQDMIDEIKKILVTSPLNVQALNKQLELSINFIYTLYYDINNLETVANAFERAIVFGNKYRSSYPMLNSDLTRAELSYANGNYSRALQLAIGALDVMHPGLSRTFFENQEPAIQALQEAVNA